jgi:branched-chain amino acid transport system permease protein
MEKWKRLLIGGVVIVLLLLIPLVMKRADILTWLFLVFLFITLSQSWNILGGYAGQVNLGHAAFFGLGALTTRLLWLSGFHFVFALLAGGMAALIFALIIGVPAFSLRGPYFIIGMFALAEILRITVDNAFPTISVMPVEYITAYDIVPRYYLGLGVMIVAVAVVYAMTNSRLGLGMMAIREDEDTAEASGVDTLKYKLLALLLSAFFAGLAGGTFAFFHASYYHSYSFAPVWTFDALFIAYVGGIGMVIGPIIGSLFYVAFREALSIVLPVKIHVFTFGTLFILVILFMPGGLVEVGTRTRGIWSSLLSLKRKRCL